jgi:hypothetical protein
MTRAVSSLLLITILALPGCAASKAPRLAATPADNLPERTGSVPPPEDVWRRFASALPAGSLVRVELLDGTRLRGTLMAVEPDGMIIKPRTRLPEPLRQVPFSQTTSIEPERNGMGAGKAVAIGVASGAASFLALMLVAFAAAAD